jgi:hypothetical protein
MKGKKTVPIDCDVFCIKPFHCRDDIMITGNFYAMAECSLGNLETGEDLLIKSPEPVLAKSLSAHGRIDVNTFLLLCPEIRAEKGCFIHQPYKFSD